MLLKSFPLNTGKKTIQIKINDPTFRICRIRDMIVEQTTLQRRPGMPPIAGAMPRSQLEREPTKVSTPPKPEYTAQTQWMLSVRDHRDRAAFGHLFDYFAPRLTGVAMRGAK